MWRGGRNSEQMWRSDWEQRANGNGGVSRHSGQMWRGERKDDQMWRSKWEWIGEWKWRDGWKRSGDQRCDQKQCVNMERWVEG